jgi:hypothetical protein
LGPTGTEICAPVERQAVAVVVGFQRGEDRGQLAVERHVDDGADHLADLAAGGVRGRCGRSGLLAGTGCGCGCHLQFLCLL